MLQNFWTFRHVIVDALCDFGIVYHALTKEANWTEITDIFEQIKIKHLLWIWDSKFIKGQWPKHTSRLCKVYLTKESDGVLHQMTWPPQSPNLNTIEIVWDELDRRVKKKQPTSAQHMWELLQLLEKHSSLSWFWYLFFLL
uniref:Tc1-like transposase DDE domain-containing protein n=1 Tax=Oncorhynchus tshawytscha TaxID=74940 RepID=A0AAZ3SWX9_ONCTS